MQTKVLAVDDSKPTRLAVQRALGGYDCVVSVAVNGAEGLALAKRERPDLILLDISMPVMDGLTVLAELRRDPPLAAIPVIMLSAELEGENAATISRLGASACLAKPFTEQMLLEKVRRIVPLAPALRGVAPAGSPDPAGAQERKALL